MSSHLLRLLDQIAPSLSLAIRADDPYLANIDGAVSDEVMVLVALVCVSRKDAFIAESVLDGYRLLTNTCVADAHSHSQGNQQ